MPAFPATSKHSVIPADGRFPALPIRVMRGQPVSPYKITDLTITTTHDTATFHFTPPAGGTNFLYQIATGPIWGGDRYGGAAGAADGMYDYTGLTPDAVHKGRMFVNGVSSNVVDFTMQPPLSIDDLYVSTTETTATYVFTLLPGVANYTFQRLLGGVWGGDVTLTAAEVSSGQWTRTGMTPSTEYGFRVLSDGVESNIVTESTKAVAPPPPPPSETFQFTPHTEPYLESGTIIYVDKAATGANNGTTEADAFTQLQSALMTANPGDLILAKRGVYIENTETNPLTSGLSDLRWYSTVPTALTTNRSGTLEMPIYLEAFPGDEHLVIIDGEGLRSGFHMRHASYWQIRGLTFRNCYAMCIGHWAEEDVEVPNYNLLGKNLVIENNHFLDSVGGTEGNICHIAMWGTMNTVVRNNLFDGVTEDLTTGTALGYGGIAVQAYCTINALVEHNEFYRVGLGVYWKDHHIKDSVTREKNFEGEIRYNWFECTRSGFYMSSRQGSTEAGHNYIHHNVFVKNTEGAIQTRTPASKEAGGRLIVEHNMIDGTGYSGAKGIIADGQGPIVVKGNIGIRLDRFIFTKKYGERIIATVGPSDCNIFDNGRFTLAAYSTDQIHINTLAEWKGMAANAARGLLFSNPDPNSVNVGAYTICTAIDSKDFTLKPAGPAIGFMPDGTNAGPYQYGNEVIGINVAPPAPTPQSVFKASFADEDVVPTFADATHYADPTATVDGAGTLGSPWTFAQAMANAAPGNIVGLLPGAWYGTATRPAGDPLRRMYPAFAPVNSGTEADPIWFVAQYPAATNATNRTEIYSGASVAWEGWPAFGCLNKDYIKFVGIFTDLNNPNGQNWVDSGPACIRSGEGCGVYKCHIIGKQHPANDNNAGVRVESMHKAEIADNVISGFRGGNNNAGVTVYDCLGLRMHHNDISDCYYGIIPKAKPTGFMFYNNKVSNCVQFARILVPSYNGTDVEEGWLFNNIGDKLGLICGMTSSDGVFRVNKLKIFNNTFNDLTKLPNDPAAVSWAVSPPDEERDNPFFNNIIHSAGGFLGSYQGQPSTPVRMAKFIQSDRNVFHNVSDFFNGGPMDPFTVADWQTAGQELDSVFANPLFTDRAGKDFTLQAGSPAIGIGRDRLGQFGPVGGTVNAGARPLSQSEVIGVRA